MIHKIITKINKMEKIYIYKLNSKHTIYREKKPKKIKTENVVHNFWVAVKGMAWLFVRPSSDIKQRLSDHAILSTALKATTFICCGSVQPTHTLSVSVIKI